MAANIRLQLLVETGSTAQAAIDGLGKSIDASIQYGVQAGNARLDVLGKKLAQVASRMQRLGQTGLSNGLQEVQNSINRLAPSIAGLIAQNRSLSDSAGQSSSVLRTLAQGFTA